MRRIFLLATIAVGLTCAVVLAGFILSDRTKYKNDFVRIFPPHAADIGASRNTGGRKFSLIGLTTSKVYLRDRSALGGLVILATNMTDTTRVQLNIPYDSELSIDSSFFFVQNGYDALLQRGNTDSWTTDTTFLNIPGFTAAVPISENVAVLRSINLAKRQNFLVASTCVDSPKVVLKKQFDGILCTDGDLAFSKEYSRIIYTYRYRNQFLVLDTLLNIVLEGKTIDTTSVAKITVSEQDGKINMSKPPLIVNKRIDVDGKYLFVNSNLVAKNELESESRNGSVIDVYNILDGSYRFSFRIDDFEASKMQAFRVNRTTLIAVFPSHVVRYDIPAKYLP